MVLLGYSDLIASELRPQHATRMRPARPIQGEDTISKQRVELAMAGPEAEILKLGSQQCLDVLWLNGVGDHESSQGLLTEGRSTRLVVIGNEFNPSFLPGRLCNAIEASDTENTGIDGFRGLAAESFGLLAMVVSLVEGAQDAKG